MNENIKKWIQTSTNALSTAEAEMTRSANPRHRAYEQILYNCQQSADFNQDVDSQIAKRAINSAKKVYNFIAQKLGLSDYVKDDFIL